MMLDRFLGIVKGLLVYTFLILNFLAHTFLLMPIAFYKKFFQRKKSNRVENYINKICKSWVEVNRFITKILTKIEFEYIGSECIPDNGSVMIIANHRCAADMLVKLFAYNSKLPILKFFIKNDLRKIPIFGFCCDALDFPFLKRFSKEHFEKHPEDKGRDFVEIRKSCEKIKQGRFALVSYVEGTRYTKEKYHKQNHEYKHLLNPKAGGLINAIGVLKNELVGIIDSTICYFPEEATLWQFYSGKIKKVIVYTRIIEIPKWLFTGDYLNDHEFKQRAQNWLKKIWQEKDEIYDNLLEFGFRKNIK